MFVPLTYRPIEHEPSLIEACCYRAVMENASLAGTTLFTCINVKQEKAEKEKLK